MNVPSKPSNAWMMTVFATALACGDEARRNDCSDEREEGDVAGAWVVTGSGNFECSDETQDASFELRSPETLQVQQIQGNAGADTLELSAQPSMANFAGTIDGSCVDFSLGESTDGGVLTLNFSGDLDGGSIEGEFDGTAPNGCRVSGNFVVAVAPRNDCAVDPCENGGRCVDTPYGFQCNCSAGFAGETCDRVDGCSPNPCQNDGSCVDQAGGVVCQCATGFTGELCEEVDFCEPDPCENGGICTNGALGFSCRCPAGFEGDRCESDIDECASSPAPCGGATCRNTSGSFECVCSGDDIFDGASCVEETATGFASNCQSTPLSFFVPWLIAGLLWGRRFARGQSGVLFPPRSSGP